MRLDKTRKNDELRHIEIIKDFLIYPEGSVLISFGNTKVICNASVEDKVPPFLKGSGSGWITSEYSMIPRATQDRNVRESTSGKVSGRNQEIQRIIGRSLRSAVDLSLLGERTIYIDAEVIQADAGTRCASITGGFVALVLALRKLKEYGLIKASPLKYYVAAVSVAILNDEVILDPNFEEDVVADVDLNIIANENREIIEIQGTAEKKPFSKEKLNEILYIAYIGIEKIIAIQKKVLKLTR
ncbi:MAG TPA: ribonuclease PH [Thermodesulfobium narugense]|uniref:ribonuclease PH n=1 Tax=Thermodesulfobium acidiphilum TaxID=1794699 RepID=UPI000CA6FE15|nr:MAG: ribonuclease PH [Thermodesulfobium narugense]HEM56316.1 ribonuclease PH [Thermodesulfobium narugense]